MRIQEGNFAYDIEPRRDPKTQLLLAWRYQIFRLRPMEQLLETGEASTRPEAEQKAQGVVSKLRTKDDLAA